MSENKPGLLDELQRWLEVDEPYKELSDSSPAVAKNSQLIQLKEKLAMEEDPEKRAELEAQIKLLEGEPGAEQAEEPTNILGSN